MPDSLEPVTLGEVNRRVSELRLDMREGFDQIERRLDNLQFVSREVYMAEVSALKREIDDIKAEQKATRRGVIFSFMYPTVIGILTVLLMVSSR